MKHEFFLAAILIITAATAAASQGEAPSTSPTQSQSELVRLLEKNGSYSTGSIDHRLKNVRFIGCRMSFESEAVSRTNNIVPPSATGDMRTQGTQPIRPDLKISRHFSFDLAEINPSEITGRFERGK